MSDILIHMKSIKEWRIFRAEIILLALLTVLMLVWVLSSISIQSAAFDKTLSCSFLFMAILSNLTAYAFYYRDLRKESITPDRWSWLIWGLSSAVEALTYQALNGDIFKSIVFMLSATVCILITISIWVHAKWKSPDWVEISCTIASLSSLALWLIFNQTFWAHILVILAVPIAFLPTWKGALNGREHSLAWGIWTISDIATLAIILMRFESIDEMPYMIIELACHATVWLIIFWRSQQKINLNTVIPI